MSLSLLDILIIVAYLALSVGIGMYISGRASKSLAGYALGGNRLPWYALGLSNASGMFDISGTMWLVYLLFIYGLQSVYIPWLWPTFNQIFLMIFLSLWLRRSGVMTGAEWIEFRFGKGIGATMSHLVVVVFALLVVLGYLAYGFIGIGKFAAAFMPWELSADTHTNEVYYGLIVVGLTALYVVKGGMFSVVITEVMQYFIMTVASVAVGIIAIMQVSPDTLAALTPDGWTSMMPGWNLDLDWGEILPSANTKIGQDGYELFQVFLMLVLFKGLFQSLAGPAPNYDMQRVLSARTPKEAAMMSGLVSIVLMPSRYMLIAGLAVLAIAYYMNELNAMGPDVDFELILPFVLSNFIPAGLLGLLIAGLLAAFMSSFAATTNAAPAYVVNDIYKRYINPNASEKTYVWMSYAVATVFIILGTAFGLYAQDINSLLQWIVSALYGGYTASNVLKWYWWRFNGHGYFWGMIAGILFAVPMAFMDMNALQAFPLMLAVCTGAAVAGSMLTPATDMETLGKFYIKTRPWGFWGPVRQALAEAGTPVPANPDFQRDMINVIVGIVWHTALTAAPIFLVIREWTEMWVCVGVIAVTSVFLKLNWYDRLRDYAEGTPEEEINSEGYAK